MSSMDEDDRLSMLPEEISSHILSLMPTKFAVRTSILSKRWRYSWMSVTNLDFDDIHPSHGEKVLSKFVDRVMESYKSSQIQSFRLHFSYKWVQRLSVSSWIDKAVRLNVCELDIQVFTVELPLSLFTCKTLTKLRINHGWECPCPCPVNLPCLKTLDIAVTTDPFVNAFKLISGCPVLESLTLEVTCRLINEKDYIFNIPTLKRLKLRLLRCTPVINKVVLNVPSLEYLFVGGKLHSLFVMEDLASLVEVSVSFDCITSCHLLVELLKGINGVESLSIESLSIEKVMGINIFVHLLIEQGPFTPALPIFSNMKHLEFKSFWHHRLILQFLESCPELKDLCVEELTYSQWTESKLVPTCMLTNLTTIKLSIFNGWESETHFLEYMLRNAEVLKTLTITWESVRDDEEEKRFCELQRASRDCEIYFIGK